MRPCDVLEREAGLANIEPPPLSSTGGKNWVQPRGSGVELGGYFGLISTILAKFLKEIGFPTSWRVVELTGEVNWGKRDICETW